MRHRLLKKKLSRTSSHRVAMLSNMAVSLIQHEQIKTTLPKAKALRPYVERLITKFKRCGNNSLSTLRFVISKIKNKEAASKLRDDLSLRFKDRNGGYTKIIKGGYRYGDASPIAYLRFVDFSFEKSNEKKNKEKSNLES